MIAQADYLSSEFLSLKDPNRGRSFSIQLCGSVEKLNQSQRRRRRRRRVTHTLGLTYHRLLIYRGAMVSHCDSDAVFLDTQSTGPSIQAQMGQRGPSKQMSKWQADAMQRTVSRIPRQADDQLTARHCDNWLTMHRAHDIAPGRKSAVKVVPEKVRERKRRRPGGQPSGDRHDHFHWVLGQRLSANDTLPFAHRSIALRALGNTTNTSTCLVHSGGSRFSSEIRHSPKPKSSKLKIKRAHWVSSRNVQSVS